jgi:hypothetical protein
MKFVDYFSTSLVIQNISGTVARIEGSNTYMSRFTRPCQSLLALAATLGASLVSVAPAKAVDGFSIDTSQPIQVFGTGCPGGTARGEVNGDTVSVIFSGFSANAPAGTSQSISCNIRMALNIPAGYTVQPVNVAYIGSVALNPSGIANVTTFARFGVGRNVKIDEFNFPNRNYPANYTGVWDRSIDVDLAAFNACKTSKSSVFGLNT